MILVLSSVWASYDSYCDMERKISGDLTHALATTIEEKRDVDWLSVDTIISFRNNLQMVELRKRAFLSLYMMDAGSHAQSLSGAIVGDTLHVSECLYANGYVACSAMTVWRMSDQRLSLSLSVLSLMWLLTMYRYRERLWGLSINRRQVMGGNAIPFPQLIHTELNLVFSEEEDRFYNAHHAPIHFTPMQQQLMLMFLNAPRHELTKQEICAALWPKKDDPSETLYTLIKRIKPILETNYIKMESERGRSYRLTTRG